MYDFETASAVLRDMERDRRHFRVRTVRQQEKITALFARLRKRVDALSPVFAAILGRLTSRL